MKFLNLIGLTDFFKQCKVNISNVVDNLATNISTQPLSASQGVIIKSLINAIQLLLDLEIAIRKSSDIQSLTDAKAYTDTSITNQTFETWIFTLLDKSTITKRWWLSNEFY